MKLMYMRNPYRIEKLNKHRLAFHKIEPHVPKMANLIVVGQNPCNLSQNKEVEALTDTPTSTIFNAQSEEIIKTEDYTSYVKESISCDENIIMSLQIEDHTFTKNQLQSIVEHRVVINYEIGRDTIINKSIKLKNVGTAAIKYEWCRIIPTKIVPDIIPHRMIECNFIFKKSVSVIVPNEEYVLELLFTTEKSGCNREIWKLNTEPNIFTGGSFTLILCYYADQINLDAAQEAIFQRIDNGIKEKTVNDVIISLIHNASQCKEKPAKAMIFTEKDIFEAINAEFNPPGIQSIPKIVHYEASLVEELKLFYERIKTDGDVEGLNTWNYKIEDLYNIVRDVKDFKKREGYLTVLRTIEEQFCRTKMIQNVKYHKYNTAYLMVRNMFGRMTNIVLKYREVFRIPLIETYPQYDSNTCLTNEQTEREEYRTDEHFVSIQKFNPGKKIDKCPVTVMRRSLEVLRNMPLDDIEARLILYNQIRKSEDKVELEVKVASLPKKEKKGKSKASAGSKAKPVQNYSIPDSKLMNDPRKKKAEKRTKVVKRPTEREPKDESGSQIKTGYNEIQFISEPYSIPPEVFIETRIVVFPNYLNWQDDMKTESTNSADKPTYNLTYGDERRQPNSEYYCCVYNSIYAILSETIVEIDSFLSKIENDKKVSRIVLRKCIECGIPTLKWRSPETNNIISAPETNNIISDPETIKILLEESLEMAYQPTYETVSDVEPNIEQELSCGSSELNFNLEYAESLKLGKMVECKDAETETPCGSLYTPAVQVKSIQADFGDDEFDLVALIERELSSTSIQYMKIPTEDKAVQSDECQMCEKDDL